MKYYLHDSNAFNDEKITMLFMEFGYEGLGLFYTLLEKLAQQEKPVRTSVLKAQLKIGKRLEKCWNFMEEIELIHSSNGDTFNKQLLNFSEKYQIKKEKNAKRISQWRENQYEAKNVTHYESVRNTPKVKESKVNRNKENIISDEFENFWNLYGKKVGNKLKAFNKWQKLSDETKSKIFKTLPAFLNSISNKQYIPYPETYLNDQRWNDEIQVYTQAQNNSPPQSTNKAQQVLDNNKAVLANFLKKVENGEFGNTQMSGEGDAGRLLGS